MLMGSWGSSANDIWVLGYPFEPSPTRVAKVWHYDGAGWRILDELPVFELGDVWGSGPNDVWLAGERTLRHFDGTAFTTIDLGPFGARRFLGGASAAPGDLWVAGSHEATNRGPVLFHGVRVGATR